jgi:hypothetical protein
MADTTEAVDENNVPLHPEIFRQLVDRSIAYEALTARVKQLEAERDEFASHVVEFSELAASIVEEMSKKPGTTWGQVKAAIRALGDLGKPVARTTPVTPSPEAITRAALRRAAYYADEVWEPLDKLLPFASEEMNKAAHTGQYEAAERIAMSIRSLASNPAEVAKIIKAAGGKHELG